MNATTQKKELTKRYIGLLDVYGFEFFEVNSFEQLCINFANEKLQQFFLSTVFENEANTYKEEGIPWMPVPYADNKPIIDLCEDGTTGIYKLLDSQCRAPNTSGKTFCTSLHEAHSKSPDFGAPKLSKKEQRTKDDHFLIRHFAGEVIYFAGDGKEPGFLEKNNDSLAKEVDEHLLKSSKPIVPNICRPETPAELTGGKKGGRKRGSHRSRLWATSLSSRLNRS